MIRVFSCESKIKENSKTIHSTLGTLTVPSMNFLKRDLNVKILTNYCHKYFSLKDEERIYELHITREPNISLSVFRNVFRHGFVEDPGTQRSS